MLLSTRSTIWFVPSWVSSWRAALTFHLTECTFLFLVQSFASSLAPRCSSFSSIRMLTSTSAIETPVTSAAFLAAHFWIEGSCFNIPAPCSWRKEWRWSSWAIRFRWRREVWRCWMARWSFPMPACTFLLYFVCRTLSSGWTFLARWFSPQMIGR